MVGLGFLLNGLSGTLRVKSYAPEIVEGKTTRFVVISGAEARRWGKICLLACLPFLAVSIPGLLLVNQLQNSPAYVNYLLPPPPGHETLYSFKGKGGYEIALGFKDDSQTILSYYRKRLDDDGWKLLRDTPISILATKAGHQLTLSFIGFQVGDERTHKAKVIIAYQRTP